MTKVKHDMELDLILCIDSPAKDYSDVGLVTSMYWILAGSESRCDGNQNGKIMEKAMKLNFTTSTMSNCYLLSRLFFG